MAEQEQCGETDEMSVKGAESGFVTETVWERSACRKKMRRD